ncbi:thylakoid lumenal 17.9 kDa protein, chloroplast [Artemisia annua]|uniref:Thylakoid lumenal 17.9 kDa protein, chloroplast n=1 Tax=Artemisia annua TaxID=35608 RepID=A0A2U1QJX7_ARTAN|nr:thylakoid lumenal 17.9 kDa protein, chloroplast [Artemisia annua]
MSFNLTTHHHHLPQPPLITTKAITKHPPIQQPQNYNHKPQSSSFTNHLLSLALAYVTLTSSPLPSLALPSINGPPLPPNLPSPTTPFSQSKNLITGLDNGKIRPCPSNNPGCVSSNPKSSSFAFPWRIPDNALDNALQQLQQAILETQKNAKIEVVEDTPDGQYLQATVDGGFGRDVLEFLVKGDVVSYRCMAAKVTYVYPFTTALGDSKGQEERIRKVVDQLGWDAPSFSAMD